MKLSHDIAFFGLAACSLFGCANSDPASEADYDDVAQALSASVSTGNGSGDVGSIHDSVTIATAGALDNATLRASGEFFGNKLGLDYDYKIACSDAAGAAQTACGRSTDAASVDVHCSGEVVMPNLTASLKRDGAWRLAKIQSGTVEISGDSDFALDVAFQSLFRNLSREYHVTATAQYLNVRAQLHPALVTAGSVKYVIDAERKASSARRESTANFHMDGVLQFAADGRATLTLDKTFSYAIDPESGAVTKMAGTTR